jgi:hypothetical protein
MLMWHMVKKYQVMLVRQNMYDHQVYSTLLKITYIDCILDCSCVLKSNMNVYCTSRLVLVEFRIWNLPT